jgi:N6-adenosine-specific RNA methylase IME4
MEMHDLCGLPVQDIAADNCVLLMWWVASMPSEALYLVSDWGFELKTMTAFIWNKKTKNGKPHFGMGHWTRAGAECCLLATKGKPKAGNRSVRSVVDHVVLRHSQKPIIFADKSIELCGDVPRIELFARDHKTGWDSFGDEL